MTSLLPTPVVTVEELATALAGPDAGRILVLDASMGAAPTAPHIPGALRFDLDGPMSDQTTGLPHTMPSAESFQASLQALGVRTDCHLVVTETDFLFAAARPWWMLRSMGIDEVSILDGGNPAWARAGHRLTTSPTPQPPAGDVVVHPRSGLIVDEQDVLAALASDRQTVVDARSRARFTGEQQEPRPGLRAGHMAGAVNLPYTELQEAGALIPAERMAARVDDVCPRPGVVASCGSGVTACVVALAAVLAGREDVRVYDGSWSEWGRPDGPQVVTGP
ncbi:3-mercaptopyruvate sulfurtransferase [Acidipropionibacterium jensenii]|uniref:Sulfurtransferase n=1 Tax=Acidipropionibacterium jensenii TaxID=1749 RepID=A0A3S4UXI4_9ACTN|nr:sulfurtransferase [Acidipropionibacterium jensenii]VEI03100.1 3-mercaptopyruvate sulfurtransferase [Acidipropionibacterium jensenii]